MAGPRAGAAEAGADPEFYRHLVENASEGFLTIDAESRIVYANPAIEEILGYEPADLVGKSITTIVPERYETAHRDAFATYLETGEKTMDWDGVELPAVHADGSEVPLLISFRSHEYAGEQVFTGLIRDVTDLKRRERELRTFREAAEHSGHSIVITDPEGTIEYVNPTFEEMTGYSRETALGQNPRLLQSGEHDEAFYRDLWETITDGRVFQSEIINERKDGSRYVVDQTIAPITDDRGEIDRFVAINREITDRFEYERRLEEQRNNLETLNHTVRHDIRNDLQLVQAYATKLEAHVDASGREYLETVQQSTASAIEFTQTARDLAEVILELERESRRLPLARTLEGQIEEIRSTHPNAEVIIEGTLPQTDVVGNEMLTSVFRNLLQNAIQHNDAESPSVTVSATLQNEQVEVRIADDGPGVADAQKEAIFGKGEQGLDSDGAGLGLYLVRTLVEEYGGRISVEDNDPSGSVFVVELPRAE